MKANIILVVILCALIPCSLRSQSNDWESLSPNYQKGLSSDSVTIFKPHIPGSIWAVFSPDGKRILTAGRMDSLAKIWDASTGEIIAVFRGHRSRVSHVAFDHNGERVATAGQDDVVRVWDVATGQELYVLDGHTGSVNSVAFSRDGQWLATASDDSTTRIWPASGSKPALFTQKHPDVATSVIFSPANDVFLTAAKGGFLGNAKSRIKAWETLTGREIKTIAETGPSEIWSPPAFSPDGRLVLSGTIGGALMLFDWQAGQTVRRVLEGYHLNDSIVYSVAYSPNGKLIAAGVDSRDFEPSVVVWDAETGAYLRSLTLLGSPNIVSKPWSIAFSPDNSRIVIATGDSLVRIWHLDKTSNVFAEHSTARQSGLDIQTVPNPARSATIVEYSLSQTAQTTIHITDPLGRRIATIVDGSVDAGNHRIRFDVSDLRSGIYFAVLTSNGVVQTSSFIVEH